MFRWRRRPWETAPRNARSPARPRGGSQFPTANAARQGDRGRAAIVHAIRPFRARFAPTTAGMPAADPPSAIHFNSKSTSCIDWRRSSGSLAMHCWISRSSAGGASGWIVEIGGGTRSKIAAITLAWLFPSNARLPVAISKRVAPNAKMSLRASASSPSSTSGAMYWKVPTIVPSVVSGRLIVGDRESSERFEASPVTRASPKSRSLAPALVSMMFAGLRSRWMSPRAMRLVERTRDLHRDLGEAPPAARAAPVDAGREILLVQMLHDEEVDAVLMSDVVEGADVGRSGRGRRGPRARSGRRISALVESSSGKHLDRDRAIEAGVFGEVDLAHPARAERA